MLNLLLACASSPPLDSGDTGGPGPGTWSGTGAPLPLELAGSIQVIESFGRDYASLGATIRSGPLPTTQAVVASEGDCVVLDGELSDPWLCDPECTYGTETCIDGVCVPWPEMAPTGEITVSGLKPGTAVLPVIDRGYYGTPSGFDRDLFSEGDPIRVVSPGADTPALDLEAVGVAEVEFSYTPIEPGEDMVFSWTPASVGRVQVSLETGWHGANSLTTIWCETADDGSLTVPASLTEQFDIPSCGECGSSYARRATYDSVDFGAGPIELLVASEQRFVAWWGM